MFNAFVVVAVVALLLFIPPYFGVCVVFNFEGSEDVPPYKICSLLLPYFYAVHNI